MRLILTIFAVVCLSFTNTDRPNIGDIIDELNGIPVYFNGDIENVFGRNVGTNGYNLGLRYQCVEFVKRYYFDFYDHVMPYSYGHAKDFYSKKIASNWRVWNKSRALYQYRNGNYVLPQVGDILVIGRDKYNPFGHIGIVSSSDENHVEIIQQNYGQETRTRYKVFQSDNKHFVANEYVLGWLSRY